MLVNVGYVPILPTFTQKFPNIVPTFSQPYGTLEVLDIFEA